MYSFEIKVKKGRWLKWMPPDCHEFKLNVDGACKGHIRGGGGLVRDHRGDFLFGFSAPYTSDDALGAEIQALYDGMNMCVAQRMTRVCIESDAALVVKMINEETTTNWKYVYWIR